MNDVISVCIPQETVNDDVVLIQQWNVRDGQAVLSGQLLVEVESSKSVFEITSPMDGFVRLNAAANEEVSIGAVVCYVGKTLEAADARIKAASLGAEQSLSMPATVPRTAFPGEGFDVELLRNDDSLEAPQSIRFSRDAMRLMQEHRLSADDFSGQGLVRREDVLRSMLNNPLSIVAKPVEKGSPGSSITAAVVPSPEISGTAKSASSYRPALGVKFRTEQLARSKKLETRILSWSTQQAIRSSVTVMVSTIGRHELQQLDCDAAEKITANLICACAQLLRQYPLLNACCIDDQVMIYEPVHVGYALDAGHGLKVAVLRDADKKTVLELVDERRRLIDSYLNESLHPADLAGATFTITDLAVSGLTTFDPIISEGHAGILGIGGEFPSADGKRAFHLILSFDHRLAEGRSTAMFLNQLKNQVIAFEHSILSSANSSEKLSEPRCIRCGQSVSEATQRNHFLVSVANAQGGSSLVCTICLQGR